ncbi:hypothetical protein NIES2135_63570 (plasmid) [Leptolyngbya boryana NIES-2135]|jgi:hypothetical protein|uniref:Uncharacterized protein n=1 Tax=Leptolyngbya boryana NIES-2135 TaxID=1973484 RepID=A0A1Z4JRZ3_LEPBY|nr:MULTISPECIES: DUF3185 family protein [Leptolyngbya]BAY59480.1 hypothetical protein NIES2135_63570 [Leptolyngbya boryana NIES-2135]MBD2373062.1 DUF3185 family protein [Leptolyngbya sp. FACHB-238]MBD2397183.1 DUF3185 family protein [Leptolyngbya sp. FACHB-239]MBD2404011.1 DUF3185 family protein [Leptolyngbya sp. FACHB-402]ULP33304.1 DUF3185 family protein [Leptolyngbya boryana IU 594]
MNKMLGIAFIAAGLAAFWQAYEVLCDRDYLWSEEAERLQAQGEQPQRTPAWDREQKNQSLWWIAGGVSSLVFGVLLLAI